jgi:CO/xanthine dehydrogenase Mo-binding subunit
MLQEIRLNVNGSTHLVAVDPQTPLLYVLRNDLGLKGAKFACGLEQCGACRVIIDGDSVPSCRIPVRSVQGREITTIEGLGTPQNLHTLQQAFIEEQAAQCGFCIPGMIVTAKTLLDRNPNPSEGEIKSALAYNLCRCGIHDRALRAIKRVAAQDVDATHIEVVEARPAQTKPTEGDAELPAPLQGTPELDSWVRINTDGTITIFSGKVELGQGIKTALAQIGADELEVSLERIVMVTGDTAQTPNEGYTAGSMSMMTSGNAIRYAAAEARQVMLSVAYEELEAPLERLIVTDGTISDPVTGRNTTYWELFGGKKFGRQVTGVGQPKRPHAYRIIGQPAQRFDLLTKVTGGSSFVHDLDLPEMVHGRVVRPPAYGARLLSADVEMASQEPGVLKVLRDGSFLAVIAEREEQAVSAMEFLGDTAVWENDTSLPPQETLFDYMLQQVAQSFLVIDGTPVEGPIPPIEVPDEAAQTHTATYTRPYQMHAALGPSAAVAQLIDGKLTIWSHTQGVFPLRGSIAQVLGLPETDIRVIHTDGPGCFGHNGADDVALDAALLARALPGRPISLKWMRSDEHSWEPYGPAMLMKMQASIDDAGEVINWNHDVWSYPHLARPRPGCGKSGLLAAWHLSKPLEKPTLQPILARHVGGHRNADPLYTFPRRRIVKHFLANSLLRVSTLRSLGAYANLFAVESFIDELAHLAGVDPLEFRLRYLTDERARAVLQAAAEKVGWGGKERSQGNGRGRGIAFARYKNSACYAAIVVDLSVDRESGRVRLERAVIAADAGQIVNPDSLSSQLEGSFLQAASMTLKEQVNFDQHGITSTDWHSYPVLRFPDMPKVETVLLDRPGEPYLGTGEAGPGPVPAAIANAIFDAVGIRLREIPFLPARVKAAMGR